MTGDISSASKQTVPRIKAITQRRYFLHPWT